MGNFCTIMLSCWSLFDDLFHSWSILLVQQSTTRHNYQSKCIMWTGSCASIQLEHYSLNQSTAHSCWYLLVHWIYYNCHLGSVYWGKMVLLDKPLVAKTNELCKQVMLSQWRVCGLFKYCLDYIISLLYYTPVILYIGYIIYRLYYISVILYIGYIIYRLYYISVKLYVGYIIYRLYYISVILYIGYIIYRLYYISVILYIG